jgi:hypothetical protein
MRACRVTRDNRVTELDVFILLTIGSYGPAAGLWQASNVLEAPVDAPTGAFLLRGRLNGRLLCFGILLLLLAGEPRSLPLPCQQNRTRCMGHDGAW